MWIAPVFAVDDPSSETVKLDNPLGERNDMRQILGQIIDYSMGIMGAITLLVFVFGGGMWLTSMGNAEKVKTGTQAMIWAAIGLFIIFGSYAILNLVIKGLTGGVASTSLQVPSSEEKNPETSCVSPSFCNTADNYCGCTADCAKDDKLCFTNCGEMCTNFSGACATDEEKKGLFVTCVVASGGGELDCKQTICE